MGTSFPHLFSPGRIGPLETSNRLVMPAMDLNLCTEEGLITDAFVAHYERRARGGVGAIIVEASPVSYPHGATSRLQPSIASDECAEGLESLADACHVHDAKVLVQLCHHGPAARVDTLEGRPLLVPSLPVAPVGADDVVDLTTDEAARVAERVQGKTPSYHEATAEDLARVVEDFIDAAERVKRADLDGVEIHAAHGYLLSTFLSPQWNRRDDEYGTTTDGRTRLLREVVEGIRARCGPQFAIIVCLDGAELDTDGGINPSLAADHAEAAVAAGADAVHVSATGRPDARMGFSDGAVPTLPGQHRELAKTIKARVDVPVIAVGRIDPALGEAILSAGDADFVSMGRQLLADPDTAYQLTGGRADLVRPCINCFMCVADRLWDGTPRCTVNPLLGRPDAPPLKPADPPQSIMVIGGGPSGLEAATAAARRGHRVTLVERAKALGGNTRFSSMTTPVHGELVGYLESAAREAGVTMWLDNEASVPAILTASPDRVIIATGAQRPLPDVPGADRPHVLTVQDLRNLLGGQRGGRHRERGRRATQSLTVGQRVLVGVGRRAGLTTPDRARAVSHRWMPIGDRVAVLGGGLVGLEIACFLAERGRAVTVLERSAVAGAEMAPARRRRTLDRAAEHGAAVVTGATPSRISRTTVEYEAGGESHSARADHVLVAGDAQPGAPLADRLKAAGLDVVVVGDAADVANIEGAIRSGYDVGATI